MKKIVSLLLILCVIFSFAVPTFALEPSINDITNISEKIYLDDGTYITVTLITEHNNEGVATASTTYTKTGSKVVENRSNDDELIWQYRLTGTFSVNEGVSATCTNATYTKTINDGYWHFSDGNAYAENNVAHGFGVFKKKVLFITTNTYNIDISISCDAYGNLT